MGAYDDGQRDMGCMTSALRGLLMFINFLLALISLAGMVLGIIAVKDKDSNLLKFCHACTGFNTFMIIVFAVLFGFAFLGFCALWRRNTCLLLLYGFSLVIFFLCALAFTILVIMVREGKFDSELSDTWNDQLKVDNDGTCDFMVKLNCSGWNDLCPANGTDVNASNADRCPKCMQESQILALESASETCSAKLKADIKKFFGAIIGLGFGLVFLTLVSIVITCKVRVAQHEYDELSERF